MNAVLVARKLVAKHGITRAKELVFQRLLHWSLSLARVDRATQYLHADFWRRTAEAMPRWAR